MKQYLRDFLNLAAGVIFTLIFVYTMGPAWERRFALYPILKELKVGMPKAEAEEIIDRHQAPYIIKKESENDILLLTHMGLADSLLLVSQFSDGKLTCAYLIGEDNAWDVPKDAPPDVGPNPNKIKDQ